MVNLSPEPTEYIFHVSSHPCIPHGKKLGGNVFGPPNIKIDDLTKLIAEQLDLIAKDNNIKIEGFYLHCSGSTLDNNATWDSYRINRVYVAFTNAIPITTVPGTAQTPSPEEHKSPGKRQA